MNLSPDQIKILNILALILPDDPIVETARTLGEVPDVPAFRLALSRRIDDATSPLMAFKGALSVEAPAPVATPSTAGGTAPEKVILWLRANPGEHTPGAVRQALAMPSGTFGEALKTLRDSGAVLATGQGAGRKIQATEKK